MPLKGIVFTTVGIVETIDTDGEEGNSSNQGQDDILVYFNSFKNKHKFVINFKLQILGNSVG